MDTIVKIHAVNETCVTAVQTYAGELSKLTPLKFVIGLDNNPDIEFDDGSYHTKLTIKRIYDHTNDKDSDNSFSDDDRDASPFGSSQAAHYIRNIKVLAGNVEAAKKFLELLTE